MINRILIRMKVVQTLYAYLLTRNYFNVTTQPQGTTRDKVSAFGVYSRLLIMLVRLSGFKITPTANGAAVKIASTSACLKHNLIRLAKSLAENPDFKNICVANADFIEALDAEMPRLSALLREASIYKEYSRKRSELSAADEVTMWNVLFTTVILKDEGVARLLQSTSDFTFSGQEQGIKMWQQSLNAFADVAGSMQWGRKSLEDSLNKADELYHSLLQLMIDLTRQRELQLDEAKHKYLPSADDLNPNTRFVDNAFIAELSRNEELEAYAHDHDISWADDDVTLRRMLDRIIHSDIYAAYMAEPATDYLRDCDFWYDVMKSIILPSDELAEALESKSVYWNDDVNIMGSFALKVIRRYATRNEADGPISLQPKFKDDEDERFGPTLFDAVIKHQHEYRQLIDERLDGSSWDPERLAFMDIVILETAIAEILEFPSIPTLATVNEYTEIANYYSTPKSGQFVTGILYAIINNLKASGRITKE